MILIRNSLTFDLFEYLMMFGESDVPETFERSFLQGTLEGQRQHLPSSGLLKEDNTGLDGRLTDEAVLGKGQPEQLVDFTNTDAVSRLKPPANIYRFKIGNIENVPRPKEVAKGSPFHPDSVIRAEVRCIMVDEGKKSGRDLYHSNCHIIPARIAKNGASWVFDDETLTLARDVTFKSENAYNSLAVLFELVMTVAASDKNSLKKGELQLTVGWGMLRLKDAAAAKGKAKVDLYGGSPLATQKYDPSKMAEKKKDGGYLGGFNFFGAPKDRAGDFSLDVDCRCPDGRKMSTHEKVTYLYLPQNYLMPASLADFVAATQVRRLSNQSSGVDLVLQKTREYLDCVDLQVMLTFVWKHFFSIEAVIGSGHVPFEAKMEALQGSYETVIMLLFQSCEEVFA